MNCSGVIHPGNTEGETALRFNEPLQYGILHVMRMTRQYRNQTLQDFLHGLMEFLFKRITAFNLFEYLLDIICGGSRSF
ncbi:hypothetical protein D3C75_793150 [compost metagenome]